MNSVAEVGYYLGTWCYLGKDTPYIHRQRFRFSRDERQHPEKCSQNKYLPLSPE